MKKIIMLASLFILSISVYAQQEPQDSVNVKTFESTIMVDIETIPNHNSGEMIFDKELFELVSNSCPLIHMTTYAGTDYNQLIMKFLFKDKDSFLKWYDDEETSDILRKIKESYGDFKIVIDYSKRPK